MSRRRKTRVLAMLAGSTLLLVAAGGCGDARSDALPSDEAARQALDAALSSWRDGKKPGPIAGTSPAAEIHDSRWSLGDRLSSYEILGEEREATDMKFSVRLTLAQPAGVQEVEYHVLGRDPLMIFRDEDYLRNINMDNGPKLNGGGGNARKRRTR